MQHRETKNESEGKRISVCVLDVGVKINFKKYCIKALEGIHLTREGPMAMYAERGNESVGSMRDEEFLYQLFASK